MSPTKQRYSFTVPGCTHSRTLLTFTTASTPPDRLLVPPANHATGPRITPIDEVICFSSIAQELSPSNRRSCSLPRLYLSSHDLFPVYSIFLHHQTHASTPQTSLIFCWRLRRGRRLPRLGAWLHRETVALHLLVRSYSSYTPRHGFQETFTTGLFPSINTYITSHPSPHSFISFRSPSAGQHSRRPTTQSSCQPPPTNHHVGLSSVFSGNTRRSFTSIPRCYCCISGAFFRGHCA